MISPCLWSLLPYAWLTRSKMMAMPTIASSLKTPRVKYWLARWPLERALAQTLHADHRRDHHHCEGHHDRLGLCGHDGG